MMRTSLVLALVGLVVLNGCKPPLEKLIVGKYKGTINISDSDKKRFEAAHVNLDAQQINAMNASLALEVKEDKGYAMTMMGAPYEGKWTLTGNSLSMLNEKIAGTTVADIKKASKGIPGVDNIDKPMTGTVSEDGSTITITADPTGRSTSTITFKKEEAAK